MGAGFLEVARVLSRRAGAVDGLLAEARTPSFAVSEQAARKGHSRKDELDQPEFNVDIWQRRHTAEVPISLGVLESLQGDLHTSSSVGSHRDLPCPAHQPQRHQVLLKC